MMEIKNLHAKLGKFELSVDHYRTSGRKNFIMGENGAGKSSFLKALSGIIDSTGEIILDGEHVENLPPWKRRITYIPQNLLLFPQYNVRQNLAISIRYGHGDYEIYREVIDLMHLGDLLQKNIWELSGGQQQRVAVARAVISRPRILLMDEPFSMQDERSRMSLIMSVADLLDRYGIDFIYVTHNYRDLELGFDQLSIMSSGKIIESVESVDDLRYYESISLMDFRNIVRIDGRYFRLNDDSIIPSDSGYPAKCTISGDRYLCSVRIGDENFFITSRTSSSYFRFDLSSAREITVAGQNNEK
ncbi:ATP-binding cassette domain-containing protein [Thermoplasma sp.]|uniref:ATP-binding cassette domain-containing protein n=1 Tax=Thermoplasma sp. TaxID=1973142 RepID=UPI001289EDE4|nr:ABC transporter ATP-binding protein [Thermoplasma sp.]KAA8923000.1 MAG: ABC transporter ATP-binding protein [Thermoplasma sp.]